MRAGGGPAAVGRGLVAVVACGLAGCGGGDPSRTLPPLPGPAPKAAAGAPALCGPLRTAVTGRVADPDLTELSGLATSPRDPRALWAIQDSGAPAVLYGLRPGGAVTTRATVTGAAHVDWEDVAALDGRRGREVVAADIGDNGASRDGVQAYRFPEPGVGATATAPATRLELRYPDGAHDAETVLADPVRDELVLVTKAVSGARAYRVSLATGGRLRRGPAVPIALATGGAVSGDGRIVVVRTYTGLVVWRRHGRERLTRTLGRSPDCVARPSLLREGQGEAVALDRRGRTARTVPEGSRAELRRYAPR